MGGLRKLATEAIICMLVHHADKEHGNDAIPGGAGGAAAAAFSRDGGVRRLSPGDDLAWKR
jgi:hypothetical protein